MKVLKYILAFYLVVLSAVPCCAFDNCPDDKIVAEQSGKHESGDEDNCGSCSPFFNCESCASITITINAVCFTALVTEIKQVYPDFISQLTPDAHYDFWQPPRIG
jgi:hypothetical protein